MRARLLFCGLLVLLAAGCLSTTNPFTSDSEQNPRFAAWTEENTTERQLVYSELGRSWTVNVENVQPKKTVKTPDGTEKIGEGGTHPVCLNSPNATLDCRNVSLVAGQTKQVDLSTGEGLPVGEYDLSVLNETIPVEVRPLPEPGDWINGTLVDLRVISHGWNETDQEWGWTTQARFRNGSTPVRVHFEIGMMGFDLRWDGDEYANHTRWHFDLRALGIDHRRPHATVQFQGASGVGGTMNEYLYQWEGPHPPREGY